MKNQKQDAILNGELRRVGHNPQIQLIPEKVLNKLTTWEVF